MVSNRPHPGAQVDAAHDEGTVSSRPQKCDATRDAGVRRCASFAAKPRHVLPERLDVRPQAGVVLAVSGKIALSLLDNGMLGFQLPEVPDETLMFQRQRFDHNAPVAIS